jgi:uncharacterized protein (DUF1015 family)
MAEIRPFKGYRFVVQKPADLSRFIAPPYDMIDAAMVEALYAKDPCNTVRITQNRPEKTDSANRDRHRRAAAFWADWVKQGVIAADREPSLYVYDQSFEIDVAGSRKRFERTGVVAAVKLVDFSENIVLPHEYTLSGPKADRYELMEETRLNTGQIFGLASDPDGGIYRLIRSMKSGEPLGTAVDNDAVTHRLYRCADPETIKRFAGAAAGSTILIADGHHRYETALNFCRDHGGDPAFSHVMMTLVSMADPGLVIRAFHRLIRRRTADRDADMRSELAGFFSCADAGPATAETLNRFLSAAPGTEGMLYCDSASRRMIKLTLNSGGEEFLKSVIPERSMRWKRLDMSMINAVAINGILRLPLDGKVLHDVIDYMNDAGAALQKCLNGKDYHGCFFIHPVRIQAIHDIVAGGERMPQKSTNFYPKLYSGLVFNRLGDA